MDNDYILTRKGNTKTMLITPLNSAHNYLVRRYLVADRKLSDAEDTLTAALDLIEDESKLYKAEDRKERVINGLIDKCYVIWDQLPKREQINIDRQYKVHYGYGCQLGEL